MANSETPREVADRIAYKYLDRTVASSRLSDEIKTALEARDARAAKIADKVAENSVSNAEPNGYYVGRRDAAFGIAQLIRGKD